MYASIAEHINTGPSQVDNGSVAHHPALVVNPTETRPVLSRLSYFKRRQLEWSARLSCTKLAYMIFFIIEKRLVSIYPTVQY